MIKNLLVKLGILTYCYRCNKLIVRKEAIYTYACESPKDRIKVPLCFLCAEYLDMKGYNIYE